MPTGYATIPVDHDFRDELKSMKRGGESYQDLIEKMMKGYVPTDGSGVRNDISDRYVEMECPHCDDHHEVEKVQSPDSKYARLIYCPITGELEGK